MIIRSEVPETSAVKTESDSPIINRKYFSNQNNNEGRTIYSEVVAELVEDDKTLTGELKVAFPEIWSMVSKYSGRCVK